MKPLQGLLKDALHPGTCVLGSRVLSLAFTPGDLRPRLASRLAIITQYSSLPAFAAHGFFARSWDRR